MTLFPSQDLEWHVDGHRIFLQLNREEVIVTGSKCPFGDENAGKECSHRVGCVVRWFVMRYSLGCNIGVCAPEGEMEIAWAMAGDGVDLDLSQVWIVPISDPSFSSWLAEQSSESE